MAGTTDLHIKATRTAHRIEGVDELLDEFGRRFDQIDEALAEVLRRLPEAS